MTQSKNNGQQKHCSARVKFDQKKALRETITEKKEQYKVMVTCGGTMRVSLVELDCLPEALQFDLLPARV